MVGRQRSYQLCQPHPPRQGLNPGYCGWKAEIVLTAPARTKEQFSFSWYSASFRFLNTRNNSERSPCFSHDLGTKLFLIFAATEKSPNDPEGEIFFIDFDGGASPGKFKTKH